MSVHSWFPLLMPSPDSSNVAGKRIEPHTTAEDNGGHQGAACKKTCMYSRQVLPIHGFCAALSPKLHWVCQAGNQASAKAFFVLLLLMEVYRPLFVSLLFFPAVPWKKAVWYLVQRISAALETLPPTCESAQTYTRHRWPGNRFPSRCSRAASGHMAKLPDGPIDAQISTSQQHALQKLSSHSRVAHFFSVP